LFERIDRQPPAGHMAAISFVSPVSRQLGVFIQCPTGISPIATGQVSLVGTSTTVRISRCTDPRYRYSPSYPPPGRPGDSGRAKSRPLISWNGDAGSGNCRDDPGRSNLCDPVSPAIADVKVVRLMTARSEETRSSPKSHSAVTASSCRGIAGRTIARYGGDECLKCSPSELPGCPNPTMYMLPFVSNATELGPLNVAAVAAPPSPV